MRALSLMLFCVFFAASSAFAASYRQIGGTIIDPIMLNTGGAHPYTGPNLQQGAILPGANLGNANLFLADLRVAELGGADLQYASLFAADLPHANLSDADLTGANLYAAELSDADLTGASLEDASLSFASTYNTDLRDSTYNEFTVFPSGKTYEALDDWEIGSSNTSPWDAGMIPAPEPASGLMLAVGGLALAVMGRRR